MKIMPQTWQSFKFQIGLIIIYSAISYSVLITLAMLFWGRQACENNLLWSFLNTIISTTLGWFLAKASTVIDYVWGAAVKPLPQGGKPNEPEASKNPSTLAGGDSPAGGVHGATVTTAPNQFQGIHPVNLEKHENNLLNNLSNPGIVKQPGEIISRGEVQSNPVG
jgi:hypothetical protein